MSRRLDKRLRSWLRTGTKLVLLVLAYFWLGASYKLLYAQTHDLTRFKSRLPISFYQQQFLLESLLHQTWIFGPAFRAYIGTPPSVGAMVSANPQVVLADYCRQREGELAALPSRYPHSLFVEDALHDAFLLSQGAAFLGLMTGRVAPTRALALPAPGGGWRAAGLPDIFRSAELARRLADEYPDNSHASVALLRLAQMEEQQGRVQQSHDVYRRLTLEYPKSDEAEAAANALYAAEREQNRLRPARDYKVLALTTAERSARERFPGKPLPTTSAMNILGYHLDLSTLDLQLRNVRQALELLDVATSETARLRALPSLDRETRRDLNSMRRRMDRVHSELWVTDLYKNLKVGVPGPPPRPQEFAVRGRVKVEDRPLAGVEVVLAETPGGANAEPGGLDWMARSRFRAVSDATGSYRITGVPAGRYWLVVLYTLHPPTSPNTVIALDAPAAPASLDWDRFNGAVTVLNRPVVVRDVVFRRALLTDTFGEQKPVGDTIRISWPSWPGATAYRVEVLAPRDNARRFERRVPASQRAAFGRHPVLWQLPRTRGPRADCPLLDLAPDVPREARLAQYEYRVTALDAAAHELASSTAPLCHFGLSPEATAALLKLRPPERRRPTFPLGRPRRRRERVKS